MSHLPSSRLFRVLLMTAALVSCFLTFQTAHNLVDFVESTRKIEIEITELCPIDDDSYSLDVVVRNNSKHTITVESYVFGIHHEGQLIASVAQLQEVSIDGFEKHTEHLRLTTNLPPDKRPEKLESCGFAAGWTASGRVCMVLPIAREKFRQTVSAGGD